MQSTAHSARAEVGDLVDPALYPRTYRVARFNFIFYLILGTLPVVGGLAGLWYFGTGHETKSENDVLILSAVCLAFVLLGAALILYVLTARLVLYADAIELRSFFGTRKLRREDISGWRQTTANRVSVLVLVPKRPELKKLKITHIMQTDALLNGWIGTLPNLDALELQKSTAEIAANRELGRTPEERVKRLEAARRIAKGLVVVAVAVSVWGYFFPQPYEIVIAALAALPVIALALFVRSPRLYQIVGRTGDARANLVLAFMAPAVVLLLRAVLDIEPLDWIPVGVATLLAAVALTIFIAMIDHDTRSRTADLAALFFIFAAYACGGVLEANVLLDHSKPQVYEATVVNKHKSGGKTVTYYLRLTPWGPRKEEDDVSVPEELYGMVRAGEGVCVVLRDGALQVPWFFVDVCR